MKLNRADQRLLDESQGYFLLEMFKDAQKSLDQISPGALVVPDVLKMRQALLHEAKNWAQAAQIAKELAELEPEEVAWFISWAYAIRRASSIEQAREVLLEALKHHSSCPTIYFNLGCYAAQLGKKKEALDLVKRAVELDKTFQELAKTDTDLEPIRDLLDCFGHD